MKAMDYTTGDGKRLAAERRRYGTQTYTWVYVELNGQWESVGDPWPCVTPKRAEVLAAAEQAASRTAQPVA